MVTVRDFRPEDEAAVMNLYQATPELHKNTVVDFLEEDQRQLWFERKDKLFLIAEEDGIMLGFVYINLKPKSINEEKARMLHLAVQHGKRGNGIARKLVAECMRRLRQDHGQIDFYFNVNEKNIGMAVFAKQLGFTEAGRYIRFEVSLDEKTVSRAESLVTVAPDWYLEGLDPDF